MTNFFNFLLGKRRQPLTETAAPSADTLEAPVLPDTSVPPADLMVDYLPPVAQPDTSAAGISVPRPMADFLNRRHDLAGRSAGYSSGRHDMLPVGLSELRAGFMSALTREIDHVSVQLMQERQRLARSGDLLPSLRAEIEEGLRFLNEDLEELRLQRILSVDEEGWFGPCAQVYRSGFMYGLQEKSQEQAFVRRGLF